MINKNNTEFKFLERLQQFVLQKLDGTSKEYDLVELNGKPSKKFIIGTLCPEDPEILTKNTTSSKISSISVSFLVKDFNNITIKPSMDFFFPIEKIEQEKEGERKKTITQYARFSLPEQEYLLSKTSLSAEIDLEEIKQQVKEKKAKNIKGSPDWLPELKLSFQNINQNDENLKLVTITLVNKSPDEKTYEPALFNVGLNITPNTELIDFKQRYRSGNYFKEKSYKLRANNCHSFIDNVGNIQTTYLKKHIDEKIIPSISLSSIDKSKKVSFTFAELSTKESRDKIFDESLTIFKEYYEHYKESEKDGEYKDNLDNYSKFITRYGKAIETIRENKLAEQAFSLMNKTFHKSSDYPGWRLFQIVFITLTAADIVSEEGNDYADLLHVDTGGGKSEAYFGLVLFAAFFDRLKGKTFGATALTKFPLRMLSIQQLQRIANIFIWGEEVRLQEKIGGDPFSVAYFVGSSEDFPNRNVDIQKQIANSKEPIIGKIIQKCPITGEDVYLDFLEDELTVVHRTAKTNRIHRLYFTDEEVYHKLPTFIVATVDKLASVAFNRKFRNILGGKLCKCPQGHGFIPAGDKCSPSVTKCEEQGEIVNVDFSQAPSIIIQDEMHLIREGFGTIDSHFESFIETLTKEFTEKEFKNIAMTATVSGATYQIKQLYDKKTISFPPTSPLGKGETDPFFFTDNEPHRIFLGLKPNVRENRYAIRATLQHILEFIEEIEQDKAKFAESIGITEDELNKILSSYKSYLSYHNKKDDVQNMHYYTMHESDDSLRRESEYKIKPITLTGENKLDAIRELINDINSENTLDAKELKTVFATNIVSHGVDIEKWNIMLFQGAARNTAEFIQARSRVGRKHVGLVFMWFYPNRIRDTSLYNQFIIYNKNIEDHVEKVPILRYAKLGFYQTINSLFCAAILNYFAEKAQKPLYQVKQVNDFFSEKNQDHREELIELLKRAYKTLDNGDEAKSFEDCIPDEVERRLNKLFEYTGSAKDNFYEVLADSPDPYFSNQMGMRGIQPSLTLLPYPTQTRFIRSYHRLIARNENGSRQ